MDLDLFTSTYTVSELNEYVREILEEDPPLQDVFVSGEISQYTKAQSGHIYCTIKDGSSQLSVVMFRNQQYQRPVPELKRGDMVTVCGAISVYVQQGKYQLRATEIRPAGIGHLYQQYLELKERLEMEGLFEDGRKRPLPYFPHRVGVAASAQGAVIHDIIRTVRKKCPHLEIVLLPTLVQGDGAPKDICRSITILNEMDGLDIIILARGGGSFEDLFCFNDESVARAIFESRLPVISAVGHESDYTIADFVADFRAPTPTAAAEAIVPDAFQLQEEFQGLELFLQRHLQRMVQELMMDLDHEEKQQLYFVEHHISEQRSHLQYLKARMSGATLSRQLDKKQYLLKELMEKRLEKARTNLELMEEKIGLLDVRKNLARGYSITLKDGKVVHNVEALKEGEELETVLENGRVKSTVKKTTKNGQ